MKKFGGRSNKRAGDSSQDVKLLPDIFPLIPALLEWIRDKDLLNASQAFMVAASMLFNDVDPKVSDGIRELASSVEKGPLARARRRRNKVNAKNMFPSNDDLNLLLLGKDMKVWYCCILMTLFSSQPNMIPAKFFTIPVTGNPDLSPVEHVPMLYKMLNSELSFSSLKVYGEFCSLIRDSLSLSGESEQLRSVAQMIGELMIEKKHKGEVLKVKAAANLLQFCIKHCYKIFDLPQKNSNWCVRGCRIGVRPNDKLVRFDKLQSDLSTFLEMKDKSLIPIIPHLMECYNTYEVALGILIRYECLPLGWKKELTEAHKQGKAKWFNGQRITFVSEATVTRKAGKRRYYVPSAARKLFHEMSMQSRKSELNEIVRELVNKKNEYVKGLGQFLDEFVAEVKFIAESDAFSAEAKSTLGITSDQIELVMGQTLRNVLEVEEELCAHLEVLNLLPCEVQLDIGRAGVMCSVMRRNADKVARAYSSYARSFRESTDLAQHLMSQAAAAKSANGVDLHFMEIFGQLKYTNRLLASSVDLALQAPVNYLPKVPLFFDRMIKLLTKRGQTDDPAFRVIHDTYLSYKNVMESIDSKIGDKTAPEGGVAAGSLRSRDTSRFFFKNRTARSRPKRAGTFNNISASFEMGTSSRNF